MRIIPTSKKLNGMVQFDLATRVRQFTKPRAEAHHAGTPAKTATEFRDYDQSNRPSRNIRKDFFTPKTDFLRSAPLTLPKPRNSVCRHEERHKMLTLVRIVGKWRMGR
ncbi:MAG: hypothetical protein QNJ09_04000 [Paracoccaceae bacterium]|nr:hypothetical protein [Paracoccaceae bacterium]